MDLEVVLIGSELEGPGFWDGIRTRRVDRGSGDWLGCVDVAVQPALVEDAPRALLRALAAGLPVIATSECGVDALPGVLSVPYGDVDAIIECLQHFGQKV